MKRLSTIFLMSLLITFLAACSSTTGDNGDDKLVIGIDDAFAPMGFRDENNDIVGFDIDLAAATAEQMGVEVKFQPIDWSTKEAELSSGRIDLIWNGYTITDERKEKVLFTKPYLANAQVIVTLADSEITNVADLAGKNIGLQGQSSASDALNSDPIRSEVGTVTEYKDNVLALNDLKNGRVDAVVIDEIVINYYAAKEEGAYKILEESLAPEEYGIGVAKGNEDLLEQVQTAIDQLIEDGSAANISEKWFGENKVLNE